MNEQVTPSNDIIEIDLKRCIDAVRRKAWLILLVSLLCSVIAFAVTYLFIAPKYRASAMFYVNNTSLSVGDASFSISSGDLVTSRNLVESYIIILNTPETLEDVIDYAGVSMSYKTLNTMISAEAVNETEIFQVFVTSPDPLEAERLANAIAYILPKRISSIIDGTSAKVVSSARIPTRPSSPSYTVNTLIGFMIGLLMTVGVISVREVLDITICNDEDIQQTCNHPILASVPDMNSSSKGGSYYSNGNSSKKKKVGMYELNNTRQALLGSEISFTASEAYKLLRTKLQFSFTSNNKCRVVGLTSALSGEGKSLTAINLAFTLSQLNKKVLLVDCDMRRPTLAEKLHILKKPGLSNFLTGQIDLNMLIQPCSLKGNENAFDVISAGQNPPNPVELLSSDAMLNALNIMRNSYDYVILDFPPVGEVTDALVVAKETDGLLLVVRQNYCDRLLLTNTIRQLEFVNSKILGIVFNCTDDQGGNYGKSYYRHYYRRAYKKYYKQYGKSYENNDRSVFPSTPKQRNQ